MSTTETLDTSTGSNAKTDWSGERGPVGPTEATVVIEPISNRLSLNLDEVWRYRDLLSLLILRDLSARYRQSVAGFSWALIKPLMSMLIFTVIFSRVAKIPSDGSPYPLFVLAGIIPWSYFSAALTGVTNSVTASGAMLTKVYFPRLILPLVMVVSGLVEVLVQLAVILGMLGWYGINPGFRLAFIPVLLVYTAISVLSVGLWMTAMNVKYRDVGLAAPFVIQCWMWLSPVVYSSSLVGEKWRLIYGLNPLVGVIEGFRWVFTGRTEPDWMMMAVSAGVVSMMFLGGLAYFRKTELTFADVI